MFLFFFNDPATTEIFPLSLHDALPILAPTAALQRLLGQLRVLATGRPEAAAGWTADDDRAVVLCLRTIARLESVEPDRKSTRLNSSHSQISYAVFCLKKKKRQWPRTSSVRWHDVQRGLRLAVHSTTKPTHTGTPPSGPALCTVPSAAGRATE